MIVYQATMLVYQAIMLLQVVWSAWLSTLGHAPSVMDLADSQNLHHFTDTASIMVDKFVPVSFQVCLLPMSLSHRPLFLGLFAAHVS